MEEVLCPKCRSPMILKQKQAVGDKGERTYKYYSCSRYPQCDGKRTIIKCPGCLNQYMVFIENYMIKKGTTANVFLCPVCGHFLTRKGLFKIMEERETTHGRKGYRNQKKKFRKTY